MSRRVDDIVSTRSTTDSICHTKTFKCSSNTLTLLVTYPDRSLVRKTASGPAVKKLQTQYHWLTARQQFPYIPKVLDANYSSGVFSFDMEYDPNYVHFFDFIHGNKLTKSKNLLVEMLSFLTAEIYVDPEPAYSRENLLTYLDEKLFERVHISTLLVPQLKQLQRYDRLQINGRSYENFGGIAARISQDTAIMDLLARYDHCAIHGDLTIENILVQPASFLLLDPNDENYISSPVVDYAKIYQSLHSGYEFLCRLDNVSVNENTITFTDAVSKEYSDLYRFLESQLVHYLSPESFGTIKFHEAIHFARLLPYRAAADKTTVSVFYAVMVKLLNEFYLEFAG